MAQPRLSRLNLWQKHSGAVLEIMRHALELLRDKNIQDSKEPQLNRELLLCFYEAMGTRRRRVDSFQAAFP